MGAHADPIFVEITIAGSIDEVWRLTQTPELHRRWDVRFSRIEYLPRSTAGEPQRFRYATRIGFGLTIEGGGETVGECETPSGKRSSALKFWSHDRKSLIETGSGYWKYEPTENGTKFLTFYDYQVRFGMVGRVLDRLVFRPLMRWGTAWSFDRLRLWVERQIPPEVSLGAMIAYAVTRGGVAFVWLYQGLVPKLLLRHKDELAMLRSAGIASHFVTTAMRSIGLAEILFALTLIVAWRRRAPLYCSIALMVLATGGVIVSAPQYLGAAFNPISLNVSVAALSAAALLVRPMVPSALACIRKRPRLGSS